VTSARSYSLYFSGDAYPSMMLSIYCIYIAILESIC